MFRKFFFTCLAALSLCVVPAVTTHAQVSLTKISSDPFTVGPGQHATEVEPHVLSNGTTLVAGFQTGRISPGGATAIGFSTSTDGGVTWTNGFLPGLTTGFGGGPYNAASDAAVAFDAKHGVWMIATIPILNTTTTTPGVAVNRSTDGGLTWGNAALIGPMVTASDKEWVVCDNTSSSAFYGNCYMEWDNPNNGDQILMSTSADGGLTWSAATVVGTGGTGLGGQPLVQPNGTVVVPIETSGESAFTSTNGGASWSALVTISNVQAHTEAGGLRSRPLPSAAQDGAGKIWTVWQDCRFRSKCASNDLVYSTSTDGVHWSPGDAHSYRRDQQHGRPLHSGHWYRSHDVGRHGARCRYLLLLFQQQLHHIDLPAFCRLYFFIERRIHVECSGNSCRTNAARMAAQQPERPDGGGLRCHRVHQWRAPWGVRSGRS